MDWEGRFKEKATLVHGGKYSYNKVNYENAHKKVCVICPEHGDFMVSPNAHLKGVGCPKCNGGVKLTTDEFIKKAREFHGNRYDYSKVEYVNTKTKVCIICPEHGEFWQAPEKHLKHNCPLCCGNVKYNTETFIAKCKEKFGDDFIDYSKVNYINRDTDIKLVCKKCGREFFVNPHNHIRRGDGCQYCRMSSLEKEVYTSLKRENISFEWHKWFSWLNNGKSHKSLDFFLPDYNIAIECQGRQHFEPIDFFGGKESYDRQYKNDMEKYELCRNNGIEIKYYSKIDMDYNFKVFSDISELIKDINTKKNQ